MDDAETVGGEGSAVGIGDWIMDDDLAAEVVSITSSQCSRDEYPLGPALAQALLDTPGSVPHPVAHREVCRTPKAGKTPKVGSSTEKTKRSNARASANGKTTATVDQATQGKVGGGEHCEDERAWVRVEHKENQTCLLCKRQDDSDC